jgi:hypothetical protein
LLSVLGQTALREGHWQLLECVPAWDGNWTWDCFLAFAWQGPAGDRLLVAVNYAPNQSQCYVRMPFTDISGRSLRFRDLLGPAGYDRDGSDIVSGGLYLDMPPWGCHVFEVK